jgi:hypothetical protein
MRWDALFEDLSAQLDARSAAGRAAEVADRSRRELATVDLLDRLSGHLGARLRVAVPGAGSLDGVLRDVAAQWLLLEEIPGRQSLVALHRILVIDGLGRESVPTGEGVTRRLGLGTALRALAARREPVSVHLVDGSRFTGTLDRVGADHVDLAEHPLDRPRRSVEVRAVRTLAMRAVVLVRPA